MFERAIIEYIYVYLFVEYVKQKNVLTYTKEKSDIAGSFISKYIHNIFL